MPKQIFLSFLGTNEYVSCNYYPEGDEERMIEDVKYVQEATIRLFCNDFTGDDLYCFFLTEKARVVNWNDNGWRTQEAKEPNKGLYSRLQEMGLPTSCIKTVDIPDGFSSDDIWEIFEKMFKELSEGDKVYFDITHAFRFIPMLGYSLLNYAKALKNVEVCGIYYGAFEKLGPAWKVNEMPMQKRNAPILNLLSLAELQDWTAAASDFVNYGMTEKLVQMTRHRIRPVLRETKGADEDASKLRQISDILQKMTLAFATNRGRQIFEELQFDKLKSLLQDFSLTSSNFIKPLNAIIKRLGEEIKGFASNDPLHWLKSAAWCEKYGMYQQGFTQLQEGILTYLCLYFKQKYQDDFYDWKEKEPRDLISAAINLVRKGEDEWKFASPEAKERVKRQLIRDKMIHALEETYKDLTNLRNDINHGGYTQNTKSAKFQKRLGEYIREVEKIVTAEIDSESLENP